MWVCLMRLGVHVVVTRLAARNHLVKCPDGVTEVKLPVADLQSEQAPLCVGLTNIHIDYESIP